MSLVNLSKLIILAAIWGSSFLFMRVAAHDVAPPFLIAMRVGLGALFLLAVALWQRKGLDIRSHWKHFLILGALNTAVPFTLFAFAAQTLPASLMSILNATAPIFGAVISVVWLRTAMTWKSGLGLVLGIAGVAILVGLDVASLTPATLLAVAAGLAAGFLYGLASVYAKQARSVDGFSNAHGSLWAACLFMFPAAPFFVPAIALSGPVLWSIVAVGILCSGIAYLLYFNLIDHIGAAPTLSVGFLIPVFGVLWGALILHEPIGLQTVLGGAVVLVGTALITGFNPLAMLQRKPVSVS
ncbi:DMT family transporter [Asticcacaulis sp. AC402]|uniref:DMT family transporter n=1 Tax=Asticcacaulis sp. AC402 TaxID=1282361 RepID=UPI0003C3AF51|nr:DMT family transporter [Asticcacaulis sp. AC402]ESQ74529.1 membrane protein [Asticcacaulis sp. AC402]